MDKNYRHIKNFLSKEEADFLYLKLLQEIPWNQVKYYKPERGYVITPRLTWVAGFHQKELYPLDIGHIYMPNPIPSWLLELKDVLEDFLDKKYNFMLFSQYRNENDSIAYHSDDEKFLGYRPSIASLSVGDTRTFSLKHKSNKQIESFDLDHGDLFVMQNDCQSQFLHSVPKMKVKKNPKFSITFRNALNEAGSKNYYKYNTMDCIF